MRFRFHPLMSAAALAAAMSPAWSQSAPPAARAPAAAPRASAPAPALRSPAESRQEATIPGDLRPDEKVTPQVVIPLRRNAAAKPERVDARRDAAASAPVSIDDAAARCEAQSSKAARARCHARIAPKPSPPPPSR